MENDVKKNIRFRVHIGCWGLVSRTIQSLDKKHPIYICVKCKEVMDDGFCQTFLNYSDYQQKIQEMCK